MKFCANLYPVTIFYTNLPKIMLSLKSIFFFFMLSGRPASSFSDVGGPTRLGPTENILKFYSLAWSERQPSTER